MPAKKVTAIESLNILKTSVEEFILRAKNLSKDGLTVAEFGHLFVDIMRLTIAAIDSIPIENSEKKVFVVQSVAILFDTVADKCIPLYVKPIWYLVKPAIRSLLLSVADGAVEGMLPMLREKT